MTIQIDQELCLGCGICMDSCQSGAIFMDSQRAKIDTELCNECEVCVDACPNVAIAAVAGLPRVPSIPMTNTIYFPADRGVSQPGQLEPTALLNDKKPLARVVDSFLRSEVAPRLVELAMSVLDRYLTKSTSEIRSVPKGPLQNHPDNTRMKRRRIRLHGRSGLGSEFPESS